VRPDERTRGIAVLFPDGSSIIVALAAFTGKDPVSFRCRNVGIPAQGHVGTEYKRTLAAINCNGSKKDLQKRSSGIRFISASPKFFCAMRPTAVLRKCCVRSAALPPFPEFWFQAVGFASHPFGCFAFIEPLSFQKTSTSFMHSLLPSTNRFVLLAAKDVKKTIYTSIQINSEHFPADQSYKYNERSLL
jgi:hypothetical protein